MAKFRLGPVLKLRKHHEERRKRDLAAALAVENERKETVMRYARLRQEQVGRFREQQQAGALDIDAIIGQRAYVGLLDREIAGQLQCVARSEHETAGCRTRLAGATVDRKALDVLRQRALAADRARQARLETAELDEVAARRHATRQRAET